MSCNTCVKVNPIPSCIDSDVFQLWGLTFPDYPSQTIVAIFLDVATGKETYFELEIDPDGEIVEFDIAEVYSLDDHPYKISFITQSSGSPANYILTNSDDSTVSGCCLEFTTNDGLTGTGGFFLSNLGCAADEPTGGSNSLYMLKSVYDPDNDGCVECAETVGGYSASELLDRANHTGTQAQSTITGLSADLNLKEDKANKGAANGYTPLVGGLVPALYLPPGAPAQYLGFYDASTNTPAILNGTGVAAQYYLASAIGNAYGPVNVTALLQVIAYNGSVWQVGPVFTGSITQIDTDLGSQLGPVAQIDTTAYIAPSTDRQYLTDDMLAAMPTGASGADQLVLQSDLTSLVVGSGFFMPETFSNGETLGNGIHRTLQSLGYSNLEAASIWPLVNSDFTIDVTQMDIDWIAWQEACLTMQHQQYSALITPGGRGYMPYDTILLPREQNVWTGNRRSLMFDFDFKGSAFRNTTGNSFICFDRYPVNQAEANGNFLDFKYNMRKAFWVGNDTDDENDCFIRIGASVGSSFDSIKGENTGIVIDVQFGLQVGFKDVYSVAHGKYGIACRDGLWSGAGANISQSNNATFDKCHISNGAGKAAEAGIYCQGNRNIKIDTCQFEGQNGAVRQIFYEQNTPGSPTLDVLTVKNTIEMRNLDFEAAGASRAGIHVKGNNISAFLEMYQTQVAPAQMAVLYEAECFNAINGRITSFIRYSNNSNPGYKFRNNNFGSTQAWVIEYVELNNPAVLNAANWDTVGGTIPSAVNFTPII